MHENWLQRYIKEYYQQIGFTRIHGPYKYGADFKGIYSERLVKIEAEWDYPDYISHKHSLKFADILVVATLEPVPGHLKEKLPRIIINIDRRKVIEWAEPRLARKTREDYYAYPWRRLSRSLIDLYAVYLKRNNRRIEFTGSNLALSMFKSQTPGGFQFGPGGKQEGFAGRLEDKALWDFWLVIAHDAADHFHLKPALLRPTWVDRMALYFNYTSRITEREVQRFKDMADFIDDLLKNREDPIP
jgi:hypothetical protein